ncbi:MAG TPA: flagellar basal body P-ring formation chaperone FlgA [Herbaspirillum sp.]|jgi:flagella basal body P-ring formation protein FlgA
MKSFNINILRSFFTAICVLVALHATAQEAESPPVSKQDLNLLGPIIERYLTIQSIGLPGKISVELGKVDPRLNLAACAAPEAFLPKGSRPWGKSMVGVRCAAPSWTVYVPVTVRVKGDYYIAAGPLSQGQVVNATDLSKTNGELTTLPASIITDPVQAVGRTTTMAIRAGSIMRQDQLRVQNAIRQGQTIQIISNGPGFQITTEGYALNNAVEGQAVQAKTSAGQVVSGVAKAGGILEINY